MSEYIPACQEEGREFDFSLRVIDVDETTWDVSLIPGDDRCEGCLFIEQCTQHAIVAIFGVKDEAIENTYVRGDGTPVVLS